MFCCIAALYATTDNNHTMPETWAIGMMVRTAVIPYYTPNDKNGTVSTLIPYINYEGDHFYLRGLEGGGHLYRDVSWEFNLFSRLRFVDIPAQYQNTLQLDTFDFGMQAQYNFDRTHYLHADFLSDTHLNTYADLGYEYRYDHGSFELQTGAGLHVKSSEFNSYYYGLNRENIASGASINVHAKLRAHLISNAYAVAALEHEWLDGAAKSGQAIDVASQTQIYAGIELGAEKIGTKPRPSQLRPFVRLDMGFGTISDFEDTVMFRRKEDIYHNKLTTIKYGIPLTDSLLTLPIEIYLLNGLTYHWTSKVQPDNIWEYTIAFKALYTLPLPWRVRIGAAEGFSWASDITYLEARDGELEGYESSRFLNYLETSIELCLGDVLGEEYDFLWIGTGVHHRSAIYELASQYGRQRVGSNYYTYYIKWELP